jgi:hypothetical protein
MYDGRLRSTGNRGVVRDRLGKGKPDIEEKDDSIDNNSLYAMLTNMRDFGNCRRVMAAACW